MPKIDLTLETQNSNSMRARQVSSMFDAPPSEKCTMHWELDLPIEDEDWQVGMIVGPSGSGKSSVMREIWGEPKDLTWGAPGVVDDFDPKLSVEDVSAVCQAVGFNTIPAWLRPYHVLSNGEKFRVDLARRLLETEGVIVVDEFTSVVDRQVAKIGSHAVQKYVRRNGKRFVAVTCHYDCLDWLQPDWVLDMATRQFQRRLLQRRPSIECVIGRLPYSAWSVFAPFHYMSATLHRAAQCFGLWADGRLTSIAAMLHMPITSGGGVIWKLSRLVTLPDYQGMGLAMVLTDGLAAEYAAADKRFRTYPAHPALMRAFDKSPNWELIERPGLRNPNLDSRKNTGKIGGRHCAVFEYRGPPSPNPRLGLNVTPR